MRLAAAGNVVVPAIILLEERGYTLSFSGSFWTARRGDTELVAEDAILLLGLASLAEARGAAWRATDEQIHATLARFEME